MKKRSTQTMGKYKIWHSLAGCALIFTIGFGGVLIINNSLDTISQSVTAYPEYTDRIPDITKNNLHIETIQTTTVSKVPVSGNKYIDLTDDEINTLATLVTLEASVECYDCQKDVASVVINRMLIENLTLDEVIYADDQFTPAYKISYSEPTETSLEAVNEVISEGTSLPIYVTYFRSSWYHEWDGLVGYRQYENTYFSYDVDLKQAYENGKFN